ncbi:methylmalonyl-CoA epimerase [Salinimicrobium tongyeongense]|uniref:Methylmalonyl-CoA epimerase n=1 Tax=Salinimicrobium tongyeongense TaxID=2809707 RepID=A0ABY6NUY2_9FLAO|nr:methylmalonyl-CoA epimerase [Salinimicrobium tongyeongense]UZH56717.1 methylmalonyl-CoA epimerase [Salinimicrobium tongyeongense]
MKKIEHIGIAVKDLAAANELYAKLLQTESYKTEKVKSEGVETSFFKTGESKIELLAATTEDSAVAKFIAKRGEGIHHIAFEVDNIKAEMKRLKAEGFELISKRPKKGADNKLVAFLHPKSANGVLVELCEEIKTGEEYIPIGDEVWEDL